MTRDLGIFEPLAERMRKTAAKEILFWESVIPSGIAALDAQIGGLRPGELTLLASEDAFINSQISQVLIESVAVTHQLPVIVVLVGTDVREFNAQLFRRKDSRSRSWGGNNRSIAEPEWAELQQLMAAPIYVSQPVPGVGIDYIDEEIEKLVSALGQVGLIVIDGIDHLNIWANPQYRSENPGASWAAVSAQAKWMALRHRCPVVIDTRILNTSPDTGHLHHATLRDFPYQGALANSTDLVCILEGFSYLQQGRAFQLRTAFSRNGLYAQIDLHHDEKEDRIVEASWQR